MERTCLLVCLLLGSTLVYGAMPSIHGSICNDGERLLSCGGCQATCLDPKPACIGICRTGCYCPVDLVRNSTGHCIALSECPPISGFKLDTSEPRPADCPPNEEYRFCEPCNKTCEDPNPVCPAQCARGCFCKGDMLRDKDGSCVEYGMCSKFLKNESSNYIQPIPYRIKCGPHQVFKTCESCERTCSNPNPICPTQCYQGCFCQDGYLKAPSGLCVQLEDCPKAEVTFGAVDPSIEDCAPDEEFLSCGWCEPSCWEPAPSCPRVCTRGCLCRPPLVRHYSGICVEQRDCEPQKCVNPNEEFVCRYGCEAKCGGAGVCSGRPRRCQLGCHCRLGLLRDPATGRCVTPAECNTGEVKRVVFTKESETLARIKQILGDSSVNVDVEPK